MTLARYLLRFRRHYLQRHRFSKRHWIQPETFAMLPQGRLTSTRKKTGSEADTAAYGTLPIGVPAQSLSPQARGMKSSSQLLRGPAAIVSQKELKEMFTAPLQLDSIEGAEALGKRVCKQLDRLEADSVFKVQESLKIIEDFRPLIGDTSPEALKKLTDLEHSLTLIKTLLARMMQRRDPHAFPYNVHFVGGYRALHLHLRDNFSFITTVLMTLRKEAISPTSSILPSIINSVVPAFNNVYRAFVDGDTGPKSLDLSGEGHAKFGYDQNGQKLALTESQCDELLEELTPVAEVLHCLSGKLDLAQSLWEDVKIPVTAGGEEQPDEAEVIPLSERDACQVFDRFVVQKPRLFSHGDDDSPIAEVKSADTYEPLCERLPTPLIVSRFMPFRPLTTIYHDHPDAIVGEVYGRWHLGYQFEDYLLEYAKTLKAIYGAVGDANDWKDTSALMASTTFYTAVAKYFLATEQASTLFEELRENMTFDLLRGVWNLMEDPVILFFATALGMNPTPVQLGTNTDLTIKETIVPLSQYHLAQFREARYSLDTPDRPHDDKSVHFIPRQLGVSCKYLYTKESPVSADLSPSAPVDDVELYGLKARLEEFKRLLMPVEGTEAATGGQKRPLKHAACPPRKRTQVLPDAVEMTSMDPEAVEEVMEERERLQHLGQSLSSVYKPGADSAEAVASDIKDDSDLEDELEEVLPPSLGEALEKLKETVGGEDGTTPKVAFVGKHGETAKDVKDYNPVIILHMHGGGFISQSPNTHLAYLYTWADETNLPILSVDYDLSPESRFPHAVNQCFAVFKWLQSAENCRMLGLPVIGDARARIILTGDSAGGNLSLAVAQRAIDEGLPAPIGILLHYPVAQLTFSGSMSRLIFDNDPILNYQSMQVVIESYLGKTHLKTGTKDPLATPALVSDESLKQFPPTILMCGDTDPLLDDSTFMFDRLLAAGVRTVLRIYRHLPHGYLNLPSQLTPAPRAIKDAANFFRFLVNLDDEKRGYPVAEQNDPSQYT